MAKRFIDTGIFKNGFLRSLPSNYKLFYLYLLCECDHCGIWQVEIDVAALRIGAELNEMDAKKLFSDKIVSFDNDKKWFIPNFIFFQYGKIDGGGNKIYQSVYKTLEKNNLIQFVVNSEDFDNTYGTVTEELPKTSVTLTEPLPKGYVTPKDKVKDKEKDKEKEKEKEIKKEKEKESGNQFELKPAQNAIRSDMANEMDADSTYVPTEEISRVKTKIKRIAENHNEIIKVYSDWMLSRNLPVRIDAADAGAIKKINAYLSKFESVQTGKKTVVDLLNHIFENWDRLSPWLQTQTQLRQINSQLPTMIETIKTKPNGKQQQQQDHYTAFTRLAHAMREFSNDKGGENL